MGEKSSLLAPAQNAHRVVLTWRKSALRARGDSADIPSIQKGFCYEDAG
jgi:hypothetical protein